MKIIYCHHGLRDYHKSQEDDLLELGEADAKLVGEIYSLNLKNKIKAIYTSPYKRCRKTAELINQKLNVPIFEDDRFNEFNYVAEYIDGEIKNVGESWVACQKRIIEAIKDIVYKYDDEDSVLCVTSGVNISAFISLAYKIKPSENAPYPQVLSCSPIGFNIDKSCFE